MNCSSCAYYAEEGQCKLHGRLKMLDRWLSCEEFIDSNQRFIGGACCGIYNYPEFSRPVSDPAERNEDGCLVSGD